MEMAENLRQVLSRLEAPHMLIVPLWVPEEHFVDYSRKLGISIVYQKQNQNAHCGMVADACPFDASPTPRVRPLYLCNAKSGCSTAGDGGVGNHLYAWMTEAEFKFLNSSVGEEEWSKWIQAAIKTPTLAPMCEAEVPGMVCPRAAVTLYRPSTPAV
eukprot:CAMPEP_0183403338 /NCGR_PEP_ID=MMETSP0370-20130417/14510_1 /TAXON_ID=268820 /ORGANISM="Peridinium aciculiferum, Strain PAER-2" /LENGTH=156 /DNA_ID=CAMNT_0025585069 /DNA_START=125 /DNA_END=596 /DNA_ORIENTATION=+